MELRQRITGKILATNKPNVTNRQNHDAERKKQLTTSLRCLGYKKSGIYLDICLSDANSHLTRASNHLGTTTRGVIRTLYYRAVTTHIMPQTQQIGASNIRGDRGNCGYPDELMEKVIKQYRAKRATQKQQQDKKLTKVTYVKRF